MTLRTILQLSPVVPVIVLEQVEDAVPLAHALLAGGIKTMEITLRSDAGLGSIRAVRDNVPEMTVGAGTVVTTDDYRQAIEAGSQFIVSPGFSESLAEVAREYPDVAFLPGVATASDILRARQAGLDTLKFFPAEANGGIPVLKALAGPYGDVKFCPTGGISLNNAGDYLALSNILCVGGSWLTPKDLINEQRWDDITELATAASELTG